MKLCRWFASSDAFQTILICTQRKHFNVGIQVANKSKSRGGHDPLEIITTLRKAALKHRSNAAPGKRRFGLHKYLARIYRIYVDIRSERHYERIVREIAELAEIHVRRNMHALRILIEASSGPEDAKQKSRWVQALQYVDGWKLPPRKVQWCFRTNGGVYGCARRQAALNIAARAKREAWS